MTIDVIIPTYKPDEQLITIIKALVRQSKAPGKIILVNTEEKYFTEFSKLPGFVDIDKYIEVHHISRQEFDHGSARNKGAHASSADFLLYMTMDARPVDDFLIENLLKPFDDIEVCSCFAKQIALDGAKLSEEFSRKFNYPDEPSVKSRTDKNRLGIKTYFCSNACAMYRRKYFEELGQFPENMIFNEDMVFAHKVIENGYKIAYEPAAQVVHFHNYTNMQQFHRNFDLAVSQAMHPEVFEDVSSESEGSSYVKTAVKYFIMRKRPLYFIPFGFMCVARLLGYKLGKKYDKLPRKFVLWATMSPEFFKKMWN